MVLLLFSFSANPVLCHRSGNSYWFLCDLIHVFLIPKEAKNQHGRKSHDKIGGKVLLLDLISIFFVCLFIFVFVVSLIAFSPFLSFFFTSFVIICPVPGCSGMFHVPGFVDVPLII